MMSKPIYKLYYPNVAGEKAERLRKTVRLIYEMYGVNRFYFKNIPYPEDDFERRSVIAMLRKNGWIDSKLPDNLRDKRNTWKLSVSAINWIESPKGFKKIPKDNSWKKHELNKENKEEIC